MNKLTRLLFSIISLANAVELPSVHAKAHKASASAPSSWWAQVGERVFYAPPASLLELSQNVSDYYYVMGSKSAFTDKMKKHVVGSQGRWHIMHLPKGPSMLEISATSLSGDRRSSLSSVSRLKSGMVLSEGFPSYALSESYQHPLDEEGQAAEKAAVASLSEDSAMGYLTKLTEFPTRSYSNDDASHKVESFLKQQFEDLGLHTCYHNFNAGGRTLTNVIGVAPGSNAGSVTVGAHYDSRPFEGSAPGAEDNGSGVAAMLAMAKSFQSAKATPKRSVYFVAFAGEEPGLIGSKHFANALKSQALPEECTASGSAMLLQQKSKKRKLLFSDANAKHRGIIMDEIGWLSPKLEKPTVNLESYDELGKTVMDHLRHSCDMHNSDSMDVVHNSNPFGSDHMSFLENGFEAALTINGDDEAYPHYHQSTDTIDNVNGEYMTKIAKMNLGGLWRMSMA